MFKKLIALVEALMIVSLFCVGFATWSIIDPNGVTISTNGGIQADTVSTIRLYDFGFGNLAENQPPETSLVEQSSFEYSESTNGSVTAFTKTTITVNVKLNKTVLNTLAYDEPYQLVWECENPKNFNIFTPSNGYITPPSVATAHLLGYPNQKVQSRAFSTTANKISAGFAVKTTNESCLYNLVAKDNTVGDTAILVFTLQFTQPASSLTSDEIKAICWSSYNLSFKVSAK